MRVFTRMADILSANVHSMLDKAEDPSKMVRMIIHDMNDTLVKVRMTAARAIADRKELSRRLESRIAEAEDWESKAEYAISKGREDLAKSALLEKRRCDSDVEMIQRDVEVSEGIETKLREDISTLESKITEAKTRQRSIISRAQTARVQQGVRRQLSRQNIDEIMVGFEDYERRIDEIEGEVESYNTETKKTLKEELDELAREDELDRELDQLKARIARKSEAKQSESAN